MWQRVSRACGSECEDPEESVLRCLEGTFSKRHLSQRALCGAPLWDPSPCPELGDRQGDCEGAFSAERSGQTTCLAALPHTENFLGTEGHPEWGALYVSGMKQRN